MGKLLAFAQHFNCTIQELKSTAEARQTIDADNFNCTIQELKSLE